MYFSEKIKSFFISVFVIFFSGNAIAVSVVVPEKYTEKMLEEARLTDDRLAMELAYFYFGPRSDLEAGKYWLNLAAERGDKYSVLAYAQFFISESDFEAWLSIRRLKKMLKGMISYEERARAYYLLGSGYEKTNDRQSIIYYLKSFYYGIDIAAAALREKLKGYKLFELQYIASRFYLENTKSGTKSFSEVYEEMMSAMNSSHESKQSLDKIFNQFMKDRESRTDTMDSTVFTMLYDSIVREVSEPESQDGKSE